MANRYGEAARLLSVLDSLDCFRECKLLMTSWP